MLERGKPGILIDNSIYTSDADTPTSFYLQRGWKEIDKMGRYAFNLPDTIDPEIFKGYEMRGEEISTEGNSAENRKNFLKNT